MILLKKINDRFILNQAETEKIHGYSKKRIISYNQGEKIGISPLNNQVRDEFVMTGGTLMEILRRNKKE